MKVDKQLPAVSGVESQGRRSTLVERAAAQVARRNPQGNAEQAPARAVKSSAGFGIQLNQQLSAMQSADDYLGALASRLGQLKMSLSRELSGSQSRERPALQRQLDELREQLGKRREQSGGVLDASLRLRLNEPVRARFSIEGLDSIDGLRRAGSENLLFSVGRSGDPLAVVLDEGLSDQQLLRRFNAGLGQAGIRAELEPGGELKFSAPEQQWQSQRDTFKVKGEGGLFPAERFTPVRSQTDEVLDLGRVEQLDNHREVRRTLDSVVQAMDQVDRLREQLGQRQAEIRDFLARQLDADEQRWAGDYASRVYALMQQSGGNYDAMTRIVVAQANLSRFTVVSLLS